MALMAWHRARGIWNPPLPGRDEATLAQIHEWDNPVLWIDARPSDAYEENHIPGAILLNEDNFERNLPDVLQKWTPGTRVVVYCDSKLCDASRAIMERLAGEVGLSETYVLFGGWPSWRKHE